MNLIKVKIEQLFNMKFYRVSSVISFLFFIKYGVLSNSNIDLFSGFLFGISPFLFFIKKELNYLPFSTNIIFASILLSYPISIILNKFTSGYFTLPMVLTSFGISYVFILEKSFLKLVYFILVLILVVFFYNIVVLDESANNIFLGSRNRKSIIFLGVSIFYIILNSDKRKNILISFFVFLACVFSIGSSGIISSFLLLLFTIIDGFKYFNKWILWFCIIVTITISIYSYIFYFADLSDELSFKLSFERLFSEDIRYEIWLEYYSKYMRGFNFFIGVPFDFKITANFNGNYEDFSNLHSSYFNMHAKTGIFSLFIIFGIIIRFFNLLFKKPYYAGLFFVLLFRSYSDTAYILDGSFNFSFFIFFLPNRILFNNSNLTHTCPK
jgi:hypothetical protein